MALTLRVTSFHSQALGADSTRVFGMQGGALGRALDNDWVLPDPEKYVSSHHALVLCRGGNYFLKDVSTNGTFINGSPQPIGNGMEQQLFDNDRIQIGDYEISVAVDVSAQQGMTDPGASGQWQPPQGPGITGPGGVTGPTGPSTSTDNDILGLFDDAPVTPPPAQPGPFSDHVSTLDQNFVPPTPQPAPMSDTNVIGDDWDVTEFGSADDFMPKAPDPHAPQAPPHPTPQAPSPPPAAAAPSGQQGIVELLMAAGLDQANAQAAATPANLAALGQILGVTTQGLIDVLTARSAVKSQFRVPMTMMRPVENNALKSSANAVEALLYLFVNQNPAYLGAVDSFAEGFADVKAHQMAMMAGMRAAFDSMLQRFDPEELERRFEKRKSKSKFSLSTGGQFWDMYKDLYDDMTQDADANFQHLFGEEFARAYEEQMQRLTSGRGRMKL